MHPAEEMQAVTEKEAVRRFDPRFSTTAHVSCHRYASSDRAPVANGVIRNISNGGFYMETSHPYVAGTVLIVRMLSYPIVTPVQAERPSPRTICLAEVKWQQNLSDANVIRYGLGMRYLK